jgi:hypothetical protein
MTTSPHTTAPPRATVRIPTASGDEIDPGSIEPTVAGVAPPS